VNVVTVWIDHDTLSVRRDDLGTETVDLLPPEVEARVESILREARYDIIWFNRHDGPLGVSERDLEALCLALDTSGALWRNRPPASREVPGEGEWPCQRTPVGDAVIPPRLLAFLYVLLRDGAAAPGDVEQHAINAGRSPRGTRYTNPHLEEYARALGGFLLDDEEEPNA
jgi:hypothetical protein